MAHPDPHGNALWRRATRVLAGGPATLSKHASRFPSTAPQFLVRGAGCRVTDPAGREYLDTIAALGPILLGYQHPVVDAAVAHQVTQGAAFSLAHPLEVEVAERLTKCLVSADLARFCLNGSDATNAAVRLARAVTGHRHILWSGYGGFADNYIGSTPKHAGILPAVRGSTHQFAWGDAAGLAALLDVYGADLAALLTEVPPRPWGEPEALTEQWLQELHDLAAAHDALFVLDEVVTGFRYGLGGAQGRFGVCPDLTCVGKALANGYPLAALCGRADLMALFEDGNVFMSATHAAHPVSLAAAKATLETLRTTDALERLAARGTRLGNGLAALFADLELPVTLLGNEARLVCKWHDTEHATAADLMTLWLSENLKHGILHGSGAIFPMSCWTEDDVTALLHAAQDACQVIAAALKTRQVKAALAGPTIQTVFAARWS